MDLLTTKHKIKIKVVRREDPSEVSIFNHEREERLYWSKEFTTYWKRLSAYNSFSIVGFPFPLEMVKRKPNLQ